MIIRSHVPAYCISPFARIMTSTFEAALDTASLDWSTYRVARTIEWSEAPRTPPLFFVVEAASTFLRCALNRLCGSKLVPDGCWRARAAFPWEEGWVGMDESSIYIFSYP